MQHRATRRCVLGVLVSLAVALMCIAGCTDKATKTAPSPTAAAPSAAPAAPGTTAPAKPAAPTASAPPPAPSKADAAKPATPPSKPAVEPPFLAKGQVLAWKRGGTTSSLCDRLTIHSDGRAVATTCKGQDDVERGSLMLNEAQRNQLNEWLRTLKPFDREQSGQSTANAVPGRLAIVGSGDRDASDADIAALRGFAAALFEQAVRAGISSPTLPQPQTGSGSEVTF